MPLGQEAVMDDDLRALLDSMDDGEEEDDLLGAFADPTGGAAEEDLALPDWMEAGLAEQPAAPSPPFPGAAPGHLMGEGDDSPDWLAAAATTDAETLPDVPSVPEPSPEPEPSTPTEPGGRPEWLAELDPGLGPMAEENLVDEPESKRSRRRKRAASSSKPRALTPQQRMLLSIFLFLDIAVLGCFLLLAIGAISF
jgi:hypothetical protein